MNNSISPVKSRKSKTSKEAIGDESLSPLWEKCIGDEEVKTPSQPEFHSHDGLVSIRCRRHKKRFNVPMTWLKTCEWLCPKCYGKLTPAERERYSPKKKKNESDVGSCDKNRRSVSPGPTITPQIAGEKEGSGYSSEDKQIKSKEGEAIAKKAKGLVSQVKPHSLNREIEATEVEMDCIYCGEKPIVPKSYYYAEHFFCPSCAEHLHEGVRKRFKESFMATQSRRYGDIEDKFQRLVHEEARKEKEQDTRVRKQKEEVESPATKGVVKKICNCDSVSCAGFSDSIASLMPRFRIKCQKCQEIMPCHKSWFDNSMVLCPGCYSGMTDDEISEFHWSHPNATAEVFEVCTDVPSMAKMPSNAQIRSPKRWDTKGGACSNHFVMHSSREELLRAVQEGRVSKARARIEINRRKDAAYFRSIPDTVSF